jgi:hypothetical protein
MTIIRTPDRTLALKCKQAQTNGQEITIHYETPGGWNHATGIIQSVQRQRYRARPFSPFWEINLVKFELENAVSRPALHLDNTFQKNDSAWFSCLA